MNLNLVCYSLLLLTAVGSALLPYPLLAEDGPRPASRQAQHQQRGFRHPAPGFARRQLVGAIDKPCQKAAQ